jgi:hypothetical protein
MHVLTAEGSTVVILIKQSLLNIHVFLMKYIVYLLWNDNIYIP